MKPYITTIAMLALLVILTCCDSKSVPEICPEPTDDAVHQLYEHEKYCSKYYQCVQGKPKEMDCRPNTVFSVANNTCVEAGSESDHCTPAHPERECKYKTVDLIPHPTKCHRYYNCSEPGTYRWSGPYERECPFPQFYDPRTKKCAPYNQVLCGAGREEATWECQYASFQCQGHSSCRPCKYRYPSCVGKEDGLWPVDFKPWSPYYVHCKAHRSQNGEELCPKHKVSNTQLLFHAEKRKCVTLWEIPKEHGGYEPSCLGKIDGIHNVDASPVSYFCPEKILIFCIPPLSALKFTLGTKCTPFW